MKLSIAELLKILEYTDITLFGKIQEKRSKYYISTMKSLFNKYGNRYYNLIERAARLNISSINKIKNYADKILNYTFITEQYNQNTYKDINIGGLNDGYPNKHR